MKKIKLTTQDKQHLIDKVKSYLSGELDCDIGGFEAEFLIDFFAENIGPHFYNSGLADANTLLNEKNEELNYALQELEKPLF